MRVENKAEDKIKGCIKQRGITITDLSIMTGISRPKISLVFSGKRRLSLEDISKICYVLDMTPNDFITPEKPEFLEQFAVST